ncbi:hypothetical protein CPB86DRAFT_720528, partial [Serendipita vermifera]
METHELVLLSEPVIPVILGPTIPHPNNSAESREAWSMAMLILFKPWRSPGDLKQESQSWTSAFDCHVFSDELKAIIDNIVVLHECKDARNNDINLR